MIHPSHFHAHFKALAMVRSSLTPARLDTSVTPVVRVCDRPQKPTGPTGRSLEVVSDSPSACHHDLGRPDDRWVSAPVSRRPLRQDALGRLSLLMFERRSATVLVSR